MCPVLLVHVLPGHKAGAAYAKMGRMQEFTALFITSASTPQVVLVSIHSPVAAKRLLVPFFLHD